MEKNRKFTGCERLLANIFGKKLEKIELTDEQNELLDDALNRLTDRERDVLELFYGLHGKDETTLREIGNSFGVTRERVRQIWAKALRKLRGSHKNSKLAVIVMSREELQHKLIETQRILDLYKRKFGEIMDDSEPIESLELSVRSHMALKRMGINTIGEVRGADLTKVRNLGLKGIEEVTEKLNSRNAS